MNEEERKRSLAAIVAMCQRHTPDGPVQFDQDCGDCGSRQEAAQLHLLWLIEDIERSLRL